MSYTDRENIAHHLNTYFVNVGKSLSQNLPTSARNPSNYIKQTYLNSFVFRGILIHEVQDIIMGLDLNKSSIGDAAVPTNYRPIAALSVFSQVFEKLIFKQLNCYIEKQNILFQYQFGFRKGHSTAQAIAELLTL